MLGVEKFGSGVGVVVGVGATAPTTRNSPAAFQPADGVSVSIHRPWPALGSTKPAGEQDPAVGSSVTVTEAVVSGESPATPVTVPPVMIQRPSAPVTVVPVR